MNGNREIEIKLEAGRDSFQQIVSLLAEQGGYTVGQGSVVEVEDYYYDTDDWWLYRSGIALRSRDVAGRLFLTIKSLTPVTAGLARRLEIEERVRRPRSGRLRGLPRGRIREFLEACGAPTQVKPLFRIDSKRHVVSCRAEANELELSLDQSSVFRITEDDYALSTSFEEIEIEHKAGDAEVIGEVQRLISDSLCLTGAVRSKFEKGLAAVDLTPPAREAPRLAYPDDRLVDTAYRVLAWHFDEIRENELGTRLGLDAEHLHDMRVATRRLRTAIRAFRDALPSARMKTFEGELRWIADALGEVRDLDVYILNLPEYARQIPAEEATTLTCFEEELRRRRDAARVRMLQVLNSQRYARFITRFSMFLEQGPARRPKAPLGPVPSPEAAGVVIGRAFDRVESRGRKAVAEPVANRLHQLRIACKRLRYICEWLSGLYGERMVRFTGGVVKLQGILGRHHDAVVAAQSLSESAEHIAVKNGEDSSLLLLALGQMIARQRQIMREAEEGFPAAWRRFARRKMVDKLLWDSVEAAYWESVSTRSANG